MNKIKRKRKKMKRNEFVAELQKRGFKASVDWDVYVWTNEKYPNIKLLHHDGGIDEWDGYCIPYMLKLNGKKVIGNQRCLKYIDELMMKG
jgi:N-acyl-L-homoserine lactone synthetase